MKMKRGREEKNPKALSDINLAECVGYELKFILIASNYGAEEGEQPGPRVRETSRKFVTVGRADGGGGGSEINATQCRASIHRKLILIDFVDILRFSFALCLRKSIPVRRVLVERGALVVCMTSEWGGNRSRAANRHSSISE